MTVESCFVNANNPSFSISQSFNHARIRLRLLLAKPKNKTNDKQQQKRKKQNKQALSPTPIKPALNAPRAERLQTMTPKHHNTQRGTHIKIGNKTTAKPTNNT